jgi:transcriptional regulator with GAF, ATPase, and Fis domain
MRSAREPSGHEFAGRNHSTFSHSPRASVEPLPVLVRIRTARAHPNPFALREGSCVLGAGREADIVIESDGVSRRHIELRLVAEGVVATDLGSKNGCSFAGQRFQSMILQPGASFLAGGVEVELEVDREEFDSRRVDEPCRYGNLLGASPAMRELFTKLVRLEGSKVNLLVSGESGTGKELIARAVHEHSPVRNGPFVAVNCGALDRQLARSELFGHRRGAFTGAIRAEIGAFEAAEGGTLFLDEIGELPLNVQPVLLRALELRRITPVGSSEERPVDVRLICATNRELGAEVRAGNFREDLFYRIFVVELELPPLRQRREDIAVIATEFARRQGLLALPPDVLEALGRHDWPGNVRELRNAVEAYTAIGAMPRPSAQCQGQELDAALAEFIDPKLPYAEQKGEIVRRFTRAYLDRLMQSTAGNQSEAARLSGLERSYLGKLIEKLGLRRTGARAP